MPIIFDKKIQVLKINWLVNQLSWSIKSILSFPFKNFFFPGASNRPLSPDKKGTGLQGIRGSTAVPQPPCCLVLAFIVYSAHYYLTMKLFLLGCRQFLVAIKQLRRRENIVFNR